MAEIVRTEILVQRRFTRSGEVDEGTTTTEIRTVVRSIHGSDASVIRDFVRALDAADAPGTTRIEARRSLDGMHLVGLVAEWTERPNPPDPPAS